MSNTNYTTVNSPTLEPPKEEAKFEDTQEQKDTNVEEEEILTEIHTYNFTLLLCGLLIGLGFGYIVWEFVRKDLVLWLGAGIGLLVARLLEIIKYPQNVVKIWVPKSSVEMTQVPNWRTEIAGQCDFYVQSDMHDIFDRYMRSTAVYHYPNTNAVTVQQRCVRRYNWTNATLFMSSPIGGAVSFVIGLIASAAAYLRKQNLSESISLFIVSFFVLVCVIILIGCLIEVELRKKRFFSRDFAVESVTNIPLHAVGSIYRHTYAKDLWKLFFMHPADKEWGVAKLGLKFIFGPVLVLYKIAVFVVMISKYNGAFAVFIWETIATLLLYQAHVYKEAKFLEPSMAFMWLAFVVNVFEIWYCWPANGRVDSVSVLGTNSIQKLVLESDKRIPKQKVSILLKGFLVSLLLLFLSGCLISSVSNDVLEDITIYNFDKSWKQNYNKNKDFIMCDNKNSTSSLDNTSSTSNFTRRLVEDLDLMDFEKSGSSIKSKYENDYDALCTKRTYGSMAVAVALASIDWFLLLLLAIYWHVNDKSQENFDYDDSQTIWYSVTVLGIDRISSTLTWIGRIIELLGYRRTYIYMNSKEAEEVEKYLTHVTPWHSHINPNQPGAAGLMPRKGVFVTKSVPGM